MRFAPPCHGPDSLPKLLQAKIIQTIETAGYRDAISRPVEGTIVDFQLLLKIRGFQVSAVTLPEAEAEVSAKILAVGGKLLGSRTFRATAPVKKN